MTKFLNCLDPISLKIIGTAPIIFSGLENKPFVFGFVTFMPSTFVLDFKFTLYIVQIRGYHFCNCTYWVHLYVQLAWLNKLWPIKDHLPSRTDIEY